MSRIRTGLWSIETRMGTVPSFDTGRFTPTGTMTAPAPSAGGVVGTGRMNIGATGPSSMVIGAGIGSFPAMNRDRLALAADRAMGMANIYNDPIADQSALKGLRDYLRAMRPSNGVVPASAVKGALDITITTASRERRLNAALQTYWPGATFHSIESDLSSGVYYAGSHEAGYSAPMPGAINPGAWKANITSPDAGNPPTSGMLIRPPSGGGMFDTGHQPPASRRSPDGRAPTPDPLSTIVDSGTVPGTSGGVIVPAGSGDIPVTTTTKPAAAPWYDGMALGLPVTWGMLVAGLAGLGVGVVAIKAAR